MMEKQALFCIVQTPFVHALVRLFVSKMIAIPELKTIKHGAPSYAGSQPWVLGGLKGRTFCGSSWPSSQRMILQS